MEQVSPSSSVKLAMGVEPAAPNAAQSCGNVNERASTSVGDLPGIARRNMTLAHGVEVETEEP